MVLLLKKLGILLIILVCMQSRLKDFFNYPIYEGLNEALEFEKTKVLIFGKPVSRKGRRMGVVLSSNSDINLARKNADEASRKIKVSTI